MQILISPGAGGCRDVTVCSANHAALSQLADAPALPDRQGLDMHLGFLLIMLTSKCYFVSTSEDLAWRILRVRYGNGRPFSVNALQSVLGRRIWTLVLRACVALCWAPCTNAVLYFSAMAFCPHLGHTVGVSRCKPEFGACYDQL